MTTALAAIVTQYSAKPPRLPPVAMRWPTSRLVTPSPSATTSPAISLPGMNGSGGLFWCLPWMPSIAAKLTPAAPTLTNTSPGPGEGFGTSSSFSDSTGP